MLLEIAEALLLTADVLSHLHTFTHGNFPREATCRPQICRSRNPFWERHSDLMDVALFETPTTHEVYFVDDKSRPRRLLGVERGWRRLWVVAVYLISRENISLEALVYSSANTLMPASVRHLHRCHQKAERSDDKLAKNLCSSANDASLSAEKAYGGAFSWWEIIQIHFAPDSTIASIFTRQNGQWCQKSISRLF